MTYKNLRSLKEITYWEWNNERQDKFPDALHNHWESFVNGRRVAEWNPHTGVCWIKDTD